MSATLKITASRLSDDRIITLSCIKNLTISATLESPVVSLAATLAPESALDGLGEIKVFENSKLLFEGKVDSQKSTISKDGITVDIDARSKAAALLDNQAQPCVLFGAQVSTVFKNHIAPYGFTLYNPNASTYLPMYTVSAGESEWDALINFTRRAYKLTPYIEGSQVMMKRPPSGTPLLISNSGNGVSYTSISHTLTPYNVISQVYLRDAKGFYSSVVNNSAAAHTQSRRKRYITPPNEYMDLPALNANQKIRRSMFMSEELVAVLPGIVGAELARDVQINDRLITRYNLMVVGREHIVGNSGIFTRLTLRSSAYYD